MEDTVLDGNSTDLSKISDSMEDISQLLMLEKFKLMLETEMEETEEVNPPMTKPVSTT